MPFITMARVSAPPRICRSGVSSTHATAQPRNTHIDDHVSNNLVVGNKVRELLLCFEKAIEKVFLSISKFRVLHTLHKPLDGEAGSNGEVIELIERACPLRVLSEPFVEDRHLADLANVNKKFCNRSSYESL